MLFGFNMSSSVYNPLINYKWGTTLSSEYVTDGVEQVDGSWILGTEWTDNGDGSLISSSTTGYLQHSIATVDNNTRELTLQARGTTGRIRTVVGVSSEDSTYTDMTGEWVAINYVTTNTSSGNKLYIQNADNNVIEVRAVSLQKVIQEPNKVYLTDSGTSPKYPASLNYGRGIEFNGVDQSVTTDRQTTTDISSELYSSFTYIHNSTTLSYLAYFSYSGYNRIYINGDTLYFGCGTSATKSVNTGISFVVGETYTIGYKAKDNICTAYINGVEAFSFSFTQDTPRNLRLQIAHSSSTSYTAGVINNFMVSSQALTPTQIAYQYNNPEKFLYREDSILKSEILSQAEIDNVVAYLPMCETDEYVRDYANYSEAEKLTNGSFDTDFTDWNNTATDRGSYLIDNGRAKITNDGVNSYPNIGQSHTVTAGSTYKIAGTIDIGTAAAVQLRVYTSLNANLEYTITTSGYHEIVWEATVDDTCIFICYLWETGQTGNSCWFDNVSFKQLSGIYPITNYTTSCNATNLEYGLQTCFWKRDLLGVPYANSFNALECDGVGYADTGWVPDGSYDFIIDTVFFNNHSSAEYMGFDGGGSSYLFFLGSYGDGKIYARIGTSTHKRFTATEGYHHVRVHFKSSGTYDVYIDSVVAELNIVHTYTTNTLRDFYLGATNNGIAGGSKHLTKPIRRFKIHTDIEKTPSITDEYNDAVSKGLLT